MSSTTTEPRKPTSASSFDQTLQFITSIKLGELEKQSIAYLQHSSDAVSSAQTLLESRRRKDVISGVSILAKSVKSWNGSGKLSGTNVVSGELQLRNLEFWLQQAKRDPSCNLEIARRWGRVLEKHISKTQKRFDAAMLFGKLFNEWIESGDSNTVGGTYPAGAKDDAEKEDSEEIRDGEDESSQFVRVGRKEMYEQQEKLASIVFEEHPVDVDALHQYLQDTFSEKEAASALGRMRSNINAFGSRIMEKEIHANDVRTTIKGLLSTGLMDEEKRTTLKAFAENPTALQEVTSVLNMRMANLEGWSWPEQGMLVEMRRHLNGKYRAFTDPEIIDALFLHYIGTEWQVQLKYTFLQFFDSDAWIRPDPIPTALRDQLCYQGVPNLGQTPIQTARAKTYRDLFFVSQLTSDPEVVVGYDHSSHPFSRRERGTRTDVKQPTTVKQTLLNIIQTECYLNKAVHGSHTILRSDLEWFGPSLPHASILTILAFLGVPKVWIEFFGAFLAAPIRFAGDGAPRVRKRGTPISYALSVVCGEAILFIMDCAVNRKADGTCLYRMHDDLWVWDKDRQKVAKAWREMKEYAAVVGLKFNESKTGSVVVGKDAVPPTWDSSESVQVLPLPAGDVRWGFLLFSSSPEHSRFIIDQSMVTAHITELRRQLAATKSIFGWVNVWNRYSNFFVQNFGFGDVAGISGGYGGAANCIDREGVLEVVETLARISRDVFVEGSETAETDTETDSPAQPQSPLPFLRRALEERFGVRELPEGYFYFPISSGGLELVNPMVEILAMENNRRPVVASQEGDIDRDDPDYEFSNYPVGRATFTEDDPAVGSLKFPALLERDVSTYNYLRDIWDKRVAASGTASKDITNRLVPLDFIPFEEYTKLRESWLPSWGSAYGHMLAYPTLLDVALVPRIRELMSATVGSMPRVNVPRPRRVDSDGCQWDTMCFYDKWVFSMYGEEVADVFGGLNIVDASLIPVGMVHLFRTSRIKLDQ